MSRLAKVDRALMLQSAIELMHASEKRGRPLWGVVRDVCVVGATSAHLICRELGWDPDASALSSLPKPLNEIIS